MLVAQGVVHVAASGWHVEINPEQETLTIAADPGGMILTNGKLQFQTPTGLLAPHTWRVVRRDLSTISIVTSAPAAAWQIRLLPDTLELATNRSDTVLTGTAPGGPERVPARLIDREGTPTTWSETEEIVHSFGGSRVTLPSFLPRKNPDVMYFSLGPVSSPVFHALFDRNSDTAIDFPERTALSRDSETNFSVVMPIASSAAIRVTRDYYKTLGLPFYTRFDDSVFRSAPMVWSSWTSYYEAVREQDITRNADWLATNLKPYGFEYVQLDDGYDRDSKGEHSWIGPWTSSKFPHGPEWLTNYIHSKGLKAGIWLVPNSYVGALQQHPEWYLRDKQGKPIIDYSTPALDSSRPDVLQFLSHLFQTLDGWGFEYYKFDGEVALPKYDPSVDRSRLYQKDADPVEVYRHRLAMIRDVIGPKRFIEGCPAGSPLNGIGFFNSYFTGEDLYNTWGGMHPLFSSINGSAFLNHIAVYIMPGEGLELNPTRSVKTEESNRPASVVKTARSREEPLTQFGTTPEEARTLVTYVSMTGVAYPLASVMPELPPDRVGLLKKTMPTLPIYPADLFSRGSDYVWNTFKRERPDEYVGNYPQILDLKVRTSFASWDVVALTNWTSESERKQLKVHEKLGLTADAAYAVFDFWAQKPLGVIRGDITLDVAPHDTRVLLIHRVEDHPQVIGISRHISGAYSVENVTWDGSKRSLEGTVDAIEGDPYTLWLHVPEGLQARGVRASASGATVPTEIAPEQDAVAIKFGNANGPISWSVSF
jgi:hypothetical protein